MQENRTRLISLSVDILRKRKKLHGLRAEFPVSFPKGIFFLCYFKIDKNESLIVSCNVIFLSKFWNFIVLSGEFFLTYWYIYLWYTWVELKSPHYYISLTKVSLQMLLKKIWAQYLGAHTDSAIQKYVWVRRYFISVILFNI